MEGARGAPGLRGQKGRLLVFMSPARKGRYVFVWFLAYLDLLVFFYLGLVSGVILKLGSMWG